MASIKYKILSEFGLFAGLVSLFACVFGGEALGIAQGPSAGAGVILLLIFVFGSDNIVVWYVKDCHVICANIELEDDKGMRRSGHKFFFLTEYHIDQNNVLVGHLHWISKFHHPIWLSVNAIVIQLGQYRLMADDFAPCPNVQIAGVEFEHKHVCNMTMLDTRRCENTDWENAPIYDGIPSWPQYKEMLSGGIPA